MYVRNRRAYCETVPIKNKILNDLIMRLMKTILLLISIEYKLI